eukprot:scaffold35423_cov35-Prasinocladus_malaysianus.AAC.4
MLATISTGALKKGQTDNTAKMDDTYNSNFMRMNTSTCIQAQACAMVSRQVESVPRVLSDLRNCDAFEGVHQQHARNDVSRPGGQVGWQVEDAPLDLLEQIGDVLVVKGKAAAQERVQNHTAAPDINLQTTTGRAKYRGTKKSGSYNAP